MLVLMALIGLTTVQLDGALRLGSGIVAEQAVLNTHPWLTMGLGQLSVSLQAPLTTVFETGELRPREWDEVTDYGRILRLVKWRDTLTIGPIEHRSLGHGTILRRYYNGVDPDHYRLGFDGHWTPQSAPNWAPNRVSILVDNLLSGPVVGSELSWEIRPQMRSGLVAVMDTVAPAHITTEIDEYGTFGHVQETRGAYALEFDWTFVSNQHMDLTAYSTLNSIDLSGFGAHIGFWGRARGSRQFIFTTRLEAMGLGDGYTWSVIDTGYLLDRWTGLGVELDNAQAVWGARGSVQVEYGQSMVMGMEYGDCAQRGRSDLSVWFSIPLKEVTITSFWRQRRTQHRSGLFDVDTALAAASAHVEISRHLAGFFVLAREFRVEDDLKAYVPTTSIGLMLELRPIAAR